MGTNVTYNGVLLRNVVTRDFVQTPIRDPSGTDIWYQQFDYSCEAVLNADLLLAAAQNLGVSGVGVGGGVAAQVLQSARLRLGEDRGDFTLEMEGAAILTSSKALDNDNGPKVTHLRTTHVSPNTLRVEFAIRIARVDCTENPSPVINNRWSCADDLDDVFRTTRTWRGLLRLCTTAHNPHDFRRLVVPVLAKGWRRKAMHFEASVNALELGYTIVDEEMLGEGAPTPACKMQIIHTESLGQAGQNNIGSITVKLDGARDSDKGEMLTRAVQIVQAKLAVKKLVGKQGYFKQLDLVDYSGDSQNSVEARAIVVRIPQIDSPGAGGLANALGNILATTLGRPLAELAIPDYDPDRPATAGPYGTAGNTAAGLAGLFACYLQSPCVDLHEMPQVAPAEPPATPVTYGQTQPPKATYNIGTPSYPFGSPGYSSEHTEAIYTFAQIETILDVTENRVQLPIARASDDTNGDTAVVVRLAKATAKRRVKYSAERLGSRPKVWLPKDFTDESGIRHYCLKWIPNLQAPAQNSMGENTFAVDVEYVYALSRPPKTGESLSVGSLPWDDSTTASNAYTPSDYAEPNEAKGIG